jgi:alkylation response protein AidB-like acyl-CoA dehydrogenase
MNNLEERLAAKGSSTTGPDGHWLEKARALSPLIEARADETEADRVLAAEVHEALKETELYWILLPVELGGRGVAITTLIEVIEELSRADGSSGWSYMANAMSTAVAGAFLGDRAVHQMYGGGSRAIPAGMLGPAGKVVETEGGYRGGGMFSFGSGSAHADWFGAGMLVMEDGKPRALPGGAPEVRVCFVPKDRVRLLGNWDVMGLVGTGSFDYEVIDQVIGPEFSVERTCVTPLRGGPLYELGIAGIGCAGHAGIALGLMKRALQEIVKIAQGKKRPGYPSVVADHPVFRHEFGLREADYRACRGYVLQVFAEAETTVMAGHRLTAEHRARIRQATTWSHRIARDVVRFCFEWSGSEGFRNPSALGRCLRDMTVANQHVFVDPVTVIDASNAILDGWSTDAAR